MGKNVLSQFCFPQIPARKLCSTLAGNKYSIGAKVLLMQIYDICGIISGIVFPHGNVLLAASFYFLCHSLASIFLSLDGLKILHCSLH